jgi:endonuclease/exonuclease/phosphatase family metal-dependent hydrolase
MKAVTWNVGSYYFLNYAVRRKKTFHGQPIRTIYFQPELNGDFVSSHLKDFNADIIFLQEIMSLDDTNHIATLANYPYRLLVPNVHHEHSILIAAKQPFDAEERGDFTLIQTGGMTFVPIHLDAHHAKGRYNDALSLRASTQGVKHLVIIGDTNLWSRGEHCIFPADRKAYKALAAHNRDITAMLHSTSYFGLGFDKVFVSDDIQAQGISCPRIRSYFMDHYPVVIDDLSPTD